MRKMLLLCCTAAISGVLALGADVAPKAAPADPITKSEKGLYGYMINNVIKAAEEMPEENYSFKPIDTVRTFGQLVGHEADGQYEFCSMVAGDKNPPMSVEKSKTTKADLIQAVKDAMGYCNKVYDGLTDAKGAEMMEFFGHKMAKISVMSMNTAHTDEHYGNMVTYLRMKGLVPPSSQRNQ